MNTKLSEEFPSIRSEMQQEMLQTSFTHLTNDTIQSQLEPMIPQQTISSLNQIGNNSFNSDLSNLEQESKKLNATNSAKTLPNLQSHVKPHEILEKPQKLKVLQVNKDDILALCQMIKEYREQFD
jgi:hypothetical protein